MAYIKVALSNKYYFPNTQDSDLLIYTTSPSNNILIGNTQNQNCTLQITSNTLQVYSNININGGAYFVNGIPFTQVFNSISDTNYAYIIDSNVGIGIKYPQYALDVFGDINITGSIFKNGYYFNDNLFLYNKNHVFLLGSNLGINTYNPQYDLDVHSNINCTGKYLLNGIPYGGYFGANANKVFLMQSNLGLNNGNPQYTLDVGGDINFSGNFLYKGGSFLDAIKFNTFPIGCLSVLNGNSYLPSGNLGIHTNSPRYPIDVNGDININGNYRVSDNIITPWFQSSKTASAYIYSNVGIYTAAPSFELDVNGNINTQFGFYYQGKRIYFPWYAQSNTNYVTLYNSNVGINTSNPAAELDIIGNVIFRGSNTLNSNIQLFTIKNTNVGIGNSNPKWPLDILVPQYRFSCNNQNAFIFGFSNNVATISDNYLYSTGLQLCTNSNTNVLINPAGFINVFSNLTINSSNKPLTSLDIYGSNAFFDPINLTSTILYNQNNYLNILSNVNLCGTLTMSNGNSHTTLSNFNNILYVDGGINTYSSSTIANLYITNDVTSNNMYIGSAGISNKIYANFALSQSNSGTTWLNTTDSTIFSINSIERMRLCSNNFFGINTPSPADYLDINGNEILRGALTLSNQTGGQYIFQSNSYIGIGTSNPNNTLDVNGSITANSITLCNSSGFTKIYTISNNIGIGVNQPSSALDISGNMVIRGGVSISNTGYSYFYENYGCLGLNTSNAASTLDINGNLTTRGYITLLNNYGYNTLFTSNNNIGIGYNNPNTTLDINGSLTTRGYISLSNSTGSNTIYSSNNFIGIGNKTPITTLDVNGPTTMRGYISLSNSTGSNTIYSSNNFIGIGNMIPITTLDVNGSTTVRGYISLSNSTGSNTIYSSNNFIGIGNMIPITTLDVNGPTTMRGYISLSNTTGSNTFYSSNKFIGLGTSNPITTLDVNGNITVRNILTFSNSTGQVSVSNQNNTLIFPPQTIYGPSIIQNTIPGFSIFGSNMIIYGCNIGICSSNPSSQLQVNGTITICSNIIFSNSMSNVFVTSSNTQLIFPPNSIAGSVIIPNTLPGFTIQSNNVFIYGSNIGINSSNCSSELDVNGTITICSNIAFSNQRNCFIMSSSNTQLILPPRSIQGPAIDGQLSQFTTYNSNVFYYGCIGINNSNPSSAFDVIGSVIISSNLTMSNNYGSLTILTSNSYFLLPQGCINSNSINGYVSQFNTNQSNVFLNNSNLGIGIVPSAALDVNGSAIFRQGITLSNTTNAVSFNNSGTGLLVNGGLCANSFSNTSGTFIVAGTGVLTANGINLGTGVVTCGSLTTANTVCGIGFSNTNNSYSVTSSGIITGTSLGVGAGTITCGAHISTGTLAALSFSNNNGTYNISSSGIITASGLILGAGTITAAGITSTGIITGASIVSIGSIAGTSLSLGTGIITSGSHASSGTISAITFSNNTNTYNVSTAGTIIGTSLNVGTGSIVGGNINSTTICANTYSNISNTYNVSSIGALVCSTLNTTGTIATQYNTLDDGSGNATMTNLTINGSLYLKQNYALFYNSVASYTNTLNDIQWTAPINYSSAITLSNIGSSANNSTISIADAGIYRIDVQLTSTSTNANATNILQLEYWNGGSFITYQESALTGVWTNNTQLNGHFMISTSLISASLPCIIKLQLNLGSTPWSWANNMLLSRCMITKVA